MAVGEVGTSNESRTALAQRKIFERILCQNRGVKLRRMRYEPSISVTLPVFKLKHA